MPEAESAQKRMPVTKQCVNFIGLFIEIEVLQFADQPHSVILRFFNKMPVCRPSACFAKAAARRARQTFMLFLIQHFDNRFSLYN
jgi:hypothetical protein